VSRRTPIDRCTAPWSLRSMSSFKTTAPLLGCGAVSYFLSSSRMNDFYVQHRFRPLMPSLLTAVFSPRVFPPVCQGRRPCLFQSCQHEIFISLRFDISFLQFQSPAVADLSSGAYLHQTSRGVPREFFFWLRVTRIKPPLFFAPFSYFYKPDSFLIRVVHV